MFLDKDDFKESYKQRIIETCGKTIENSYVEERFLVLGNMVRDYANINWNKSISETYIQQSKQVYYFSMEFLLGRMLKNNLKNLGIYEIVKDGLNELNIDLDSVLEVETDPGLGNGGLGRLAACFMDSGATLNYPIQGNCIRYQYGLFKQGINEDGEQVEIPDLWLRFGNPFEIRKNQAIVDVKFWGKINVTGDINGDLHFEHVDAENVRAVPYDMAMIGANTQMTNTLRLWSAEPSENTPNNKDYRQYVSEVNEICMNVYPDDSTEHGKFLRLKQQYFFVAAGLKSIVRSHLGQYQTLDNLAEKVSIQLNDTHPVLAIPELMRILMDEHGYKWSQAFEITRSVMSYTNHTILSEALETWPIAYVEALLPRIYMIIEELNRQYLREDEHSTPIIENNMVHMARLAVYGSKMVNGVAEIHSQIIKDSLFNYAYRTHPEKFTNKTNGITPRRWMLYSNDELVELLEEYIGSGFKKDFFEIQELLNYVNDPTLQEKFLEVKRQRKLRLNNVILKTTGIVLTGDEIYDVQAKRLHGYKRQLLNILHVIYLYQRAIEDPNFRIKPHVFIFAAKAAPSYVFAKKVIKLINKVANVVNYDERVRDFIKVVFIPNYSVSLSEVLIGATDISEQISMAGKEASGTGNMKFMMNGAITIGTMDGANVEIHKLVGDENSVIFGKRVEEISDFVKSYRAIEYVQQDPRIFKALNSLIDGTWSNQVDDFRQIYDELLSKNDEYIVLADFDSYVKAQEEICRRYDDRHGWAKSCLINIGQSGYFSSDRTIEDYAKEIWQLEKVNIKQ